MNKRWVFIGLLAIFGLAGCNQDNNKGDRPPLKPFAYSGTPTTVNLSQLDETHQKVLADSATRGVAVALQYRQGNRHKVLSRLAKVVSGTGVDGLSPPGHKTQLPNPVPCTSPKGTIHYSARDSKGDYLLVNFDHVCVPWVAGSTPAKNLIVNGDLVVDTAFHSFASSNLTILDTVDLETYKVPVGSFKLIGSHLAKLYSCIHGVCMVDDGKFNGSFSSSYTSGATATSIYDPDLGKVKVAASQLKLCHKGLGMGLSSPFSSGQLTLSDGTNLLVLTYSGCGQSYHGGNW